MTRYNLPEFATDSWVSEALRIAYQLATASPDPSTQNGAFILDREATVHGQACNTFTTGIDITPDLLERPKKYAYIEHAERNAIYTAARGGHIPWIMVCPWAACADCARAIVQSGIEILIRHQAEDTEHWQDSITDGDQIMRAGGVQIITYAGKVHGPRVRRNGKILEP